MRHAFGKATGLVGVIHKAILANRPHMCGILVHAPWHNLTARLRGLAFTDYEDSQVANNPMHLFGTLWMSHSREALYMGIDMEKQASQ